MAISSKIRSNLSLRTYQRYNKKINEEDKQIWYSITKDQVGTELSRLKESLEHTYQVAKELSDKEYDKRLDALERNESRLNIVRLLIYGPKFVQLDFGADCLTGNALATASKTGYKPMRLETLKARNPEIYKELALV